MEPERVRAANNCAVTTAADLYLDLLKKCLTREVFEDGYRLIPGSSAKFRFARGIARAFGGELVKPSHFDPDARAAGTDWPVSAETMAGSKRLEQTQNLVTNALDQSVPGDLVETGVWRGGMTILMRGILKAYGDTERKVWVVDSFQGLPKVTTGVDAGDKHHAIPELAVSADQVRDNFRRYNLLDDQVRFLEGWFSDTLPGAPIERIAVLRLDGDLYDSTMDALNALYLKVSPGGWVIIDDWGSHDTCKQAVEEYRAAHSITSRLDESLWPTAVWQVP